MRVIIHLEGINHLYLRPPDGLEAYLAPTLEAIFNSDGPIYGDEIAALLMSDGHLYKQMMDTGRYADRQTVLRSRGGVDIDAELYDAIVCIVDAALPYVSSPVAGQLRYARITHAVFIAPGTLAIDLGY